MKKTIGIIGGMGPMATCDLFKKIIDATDAATDQEHVRVVIDSNTEIPDRTAAILGGGADPVPELVRSALGLQGMGADVLIMPCNTAHYFYDSICRFVDIPVLHMIRETAKELKAQGVSTVALLATDATVRTGIYSSVFEEAGIEMLVPSPEGQKEIMRVIYEGVKAGRTEMELGALRRELDSLLARGAEKLVLGCTELPIAFDIYDLDYPTADPTNILARAAVKAVGAGLR